jgi:nitroreductase
MMLAAWNEGVVSCPNGFTDADEAARILELEGDQRPLTALSFGYPARRRDVEGTPAAEWSGEADRRPLDETVRLV